MNNQLAIALTEIIANAIIDKHSYAYRAFDAEDAEKIHKHLKAAMSSHSMIEITESIVAKHNLVNRYRKLIVIVLKFIKSKMSVNGQHCCISYYDPFASSRQL